MPSWSHSAVAASLSDSVIISRASCRSLADRRLRCSRWRLLSKVARMIVLTTLAES